MKIGVIVDRLQLARWQADALKELGPGVEVFLYNCTNTGAPRRQLRHTGYYALRLISLRLRVTRTVPLPPELPVSAIVDLESEADGTWQRLPPELIERIRADAPDVVLKFGMHLLRVPADLGIPILSYHHGDPREFRGRPAGFYELLHGHNTIGQVVQILSNRLDAGEIVAYGETRAYAHSWRATMTEAYGISRMLLPQALRNVRFGVRLPIAPEGRNYRLPSNWTVIRFLWSRFAGTAARLAYGLFLEKAWRVAEVELDPRGAADLLERLPAARQWRVLDTPKGYRFIADPFYAGSAGALLVEALKSSGRGEILRIAGQEVDRLSDCPGHLSYPATLEVEGGTVVLPEMSEWSSARLYWLRGDRLDDLGELDFKGSRRLVDPTLYAREGTFYLFASLAGESLSVLRLWVADAPLGPWREHPQSPIRISPAGSRMGGSILSFGGKTWRVGQDLRNGYGDGIILFEVKELSPQSYVEEHVSELRFRDVRGPHTINLGPGRVVFDFYRERFSLLAGVRRLAARLDARPL